MDTRRIPPVMAALLGCIVATSACDRRGSVHPCLSAMPCLSPPEEPERCLSVEEPEPPPPDEPPDGAEDDAPAPESARADATSQILQRVASALPADVLARLHARHG